VILFRLHKDTAIEEYIRTDCLFFDLKSNTVREYFGSRNDFYCKKYIKLKKQAKQESNKTPNRDAVALRRNSERSLPNDGNNINSSRGLNTEREPNDSNKDNKENILILVDNKNNENTAGDDVWRNNFIGQETKNENVNTNIDENLNSRETSIKLNPITLRDFEYLIPEHIPIYDLRPSDTFIKDEIHNTHRLLSVIYKKSIIDPVIIRSTKLLFHTCSSFALSALCYTDYFIQKQAENKSVYIYLCRTLIIFHQVQNLPRQWYLFH
jgi:hypothetical protein